MSQVHLGLLASGPVGIEAVGRAARLAGEDFVLLGVDERSDPDEKARFCEKAPHLDVLSLGPSFRSEELAGIEAAKVDVLVLAWWPYIIRPEQIQAARVGCLNFHPSLLPHNRGKDPNFWALVEERPYGVTIHWVDDGVDSGDIAFQREIPVTWEDTGETLYRKGSEAILELFEASLPAILAGEIPRHPQGDHGSFHRREELEPASKIQLDSRMAVRELLNLLRARTFAPHPGVRFRDGDEVYEVRISIDAVEQGQGR